MALKPRRARKARRRVPRRRAQAHHPLHEAAGQRLHRRDGDAAGDVDFVGTFNGETTLPLALDKAGKSLIGVDNAISKPMFRDDETKEQGGMSNCGDEFGVVVSSYFSSEDIFDFVFKGDYGLPDKAKFKILELELES